MFIVIHVVNNFDGSNINEPKMFTLSTYLKLLWFHWSLLSTAHSPAPFLVFFSIFITIQFIYYTILPLKACNSIVFSMFIYLLMFLSLLSSAPLLDIL